MTNPLLLNEAEGYTSREAAQLVGIEQSQIRKFVQAGFLAPERSPDNRYLFSFQDLRFLKTTTSLFQSDLPRRRVNRALRELRRQHPVDRPLSELRLIVETGEILADDGEAIWQADSGQLLMPWDYPAEADTEDYQYDDEIEIEVDLEDSVSDLSEVRAAREADWWYDQAEELEDQSPAKARHAYREALTLNPYHVNARINLGRLLHIDGQLEEAIDQYREALRLEPERATAAYNLGLALEDSGQLNEAFTAFAQAIAADGHLAEAHGAIAHLYERAGDQLAAARHLKTYNRLRNEP
ncbi:MAG: tetratricopeptide repeat protein [Gemmatimonadota bacterium]|nr:tetratricopeptide repeat protein [Gemmatimonadota bacterium]